MKELAVKTHKFENTKNELKRFSEQSIKDIELRKVEVAGGFLWLGNHKVTGDELNELTSDIQKHLIKNNEFHTKFIKEFGQVYQALEALDKEYIQAILMAIKSSEKANEDVKIAQKDIGKTIDLQKKTILALKTFKDKIEKYEHLKDIDILWDESDSVKEKISETNKRVISSKKTIDKNIESIKKLEKTDNNNLKLIKELETFKEVSSKSIETLKTFKDKIEKYEHLKDIDQLWDVSLEHKSCLQNVSDQLNEHEQTMSLQKEIVNKHEEKVNLQSEKILDQAEFIEKIFQQGSEQAEQISIQAVEIDKLENIIKDMQGVNIEKNIQTCKKIKFAFGLAGAAMFLVILEFILIMTGVI